MTTTADPREIARWARIVTANRLISLDSRTWKNTGQGGSTFGGAEFCTPTLALADSFEEMAMGVDAREVARFVNMEGWSTGKGGSQYMGPDRPSNCHPLGWTAGITSAGMSRRLDNIHPGETMPDLLTTTPPPRQCAIPLLVELCAGTAALSLRLERAKARPPVSRMGSKSGYADAILALAGLQPGDKAERYLWCEPDDGVRLLLHAYRDAALAREAAAIIRGWADEEPRALWERLRAEGPAVCPPVDAACVARWSFVQANKVPHAECWKTVPRARVACGVEANLSANGLASRFFGGLPATIHDDARTLDPPDEMPPGALVYADPPYRDTTGYANLFPRSEWVPVVRRWADAGARCMVSEAEPIPDLMADGWHAVEITAMRQGQKRTFSKQQREWVTMNFEPDARARLVCERALERLTMREAATVGGEQADLFGGA